MTDLPIYPSFHSATVKQGLSFEERVRLASEAGYRATAFDVQGGLDFDRDHGAGAAKALLKSRGLDRADGAELHPCLPPKRNSRRAFVISRSARRSPPMPVRGTARRSFPTGPTFRKMNRLS